MDWNAIGALFDKHGWPTIILALIVVFFYKKVWPLFEKFIQEIIEQLKAMTVAMQEMTETLSGISNKQESSIKDNVELANHILDEIRKGRK